VGYERGGAVVSIYGSFGVFDGGEPDQPAPIVYQGSHILPSTDDPRAGNFDLGLINGWITAQGRTGPTDEALWPYLRAGAGDAEGRQVELVFDVEQVEQLHADLGWWLEHVDRSAR
jgi:hypothetical protein